jgi:hypothetical protein
MLATSNIVTHIWGGPKRPLPTVEQVSWAFSEHRHFAAIGELSLLDGLGLGGDLG